MKTIITYGTFDMFHIGHLNLIEKLNGMADRLVVAVSTDEFNESKGKKTLIPYEQRSKIVGSIRHVDLVIPEESWEQKLNDVKQYDVDVFAIGEDWEGKFDFLKPYCEVVYLQRTKDISTTQIKNSIKRTLSIPYDDLAKAFEVLETLKKDLS